jgi:hypothetical protein
VDDDAAEDDETNDDDGAGDARLANAAAAAGARPLCGLKLAEPPVTVGAVADMVATALLLHGARKRTNKNAKFNEFAKTRKESWSNKGEDEIGAKKRKLDQQGGML